MIDVEVKKPSYDVQKYVIDLERDAAKNLSPGIEDLRKIHGDHFANEILMSVCALLSARAIGMVHVWTGESPERVTKRFVEAVDANVKPTIRKIVEKMANKAKVQ